jgi:hypothetical protein
MAENGKLKAESRADAPFQLATANLDDASSV